MVVLFSDVLCACSQAQDRKFQRLKDLYNIIVDPEDKRELLHEMKALVRVRIFNFVTRSRLYLGFLRLVLTTKIQQRSQLFRRKEPSLTATASLPLMMTVEHVTLYSKPSTKHRATLSWTMHEDLCLYDPDLICTQIKAPSVASPVVSPDVSPAPSAAVVSVIAYTPAPLTELTMSKGKKHKKKDKP